MAGEFDEAVKYERVLLVPSDQLTQEQHPADRAFRFAEICEAACLGLF